MEIKIKDEKPIGKVVEFFLTRNGDIINLMASDGESRWIVCSIRTKENKGIFIDQQYGGTDSALDIERN